MCDVVIEAINDVRPEVRTYFLETDESRKVINWKKKNITKPNQFQNLIKKKSICKIVMFIHDCSLFCLGTYTSFKSV